MSAPDLGQSRLPGLTESVGFWLKVALGAVTAWFLLKIFDHIGDAFLLRRASNLLGNDPAIVGGFSDVVPAAWVATVKAVEALAALGTVVLIALRELAFSASRYAIVFLLGSPAKSGLRIFDLLKPKQKLSVEEILHALQASAQSPAQEASPTVATPEQVTTTVYITKPPETAPLTEAVLKALPPQAKLPTEPSN